MNREMANAEFIKNMRARIDDLELLVAGRDAVINVLQGTLEERAERIKGLLAERDAAVRANDELRQKIAERESRRREAEVAIDDARSRLFEAAKLIQ